jgi:SET domain-containing protein
LKGGDFICEYQGELISRNEGEKREKEYPLSLGSFMYFFRERMTQRVMW